MNTELTVSAPVWDGDRAPLAKAFVAAQRATEAVKKASTNPAFRSKYADLAGCVEAVVPALNSAGVGLIQCASFDGEMAAVTTTLLHESGSSVSSVLHLRPSKLDPQGVGSAITYARRYSLLAMTGAAPEDDDGNAASGPREAPANGPARKSSAQAKRDGDDQLIKDAVASIESEDALDMWARQVLPGIMAKLPLSWADAITDIVELRREEILSARQAA